MATPILKSAGYKHGDEIVTPDNIKKNNKILGILIIFLFFLAILNLHLQFVSSPIPFILTFLVAISWVFYGSNLTSSNERITVGPRYIVCGAKIIYFSKITNILISSSQCILKVHDKVLLRIDIDKFISVSNKAPKIKLNRERKFKAIVDTISNNAPIEKPDIKIENI